MEKCELLIFGHEQFPIPVAPKCLGSYYCRWKELASQFSHTTASLAVEQTTINAWMKFAILTQACWEHVTIPYPWSFGALVDSGFIVNGSKDPLGLGTSIEAFETRNRFPSQIKVQEKLTPLGFGLSFQKKQIWNIW